MPLFLSRQIFKNTDMEYSTYIINGGIRIIYNTDLMDWHKAVVEMVISQDRGYYVGTLISKLLMFAIIWLITMKKDRYSVLLKRDLSIL